MENYAVGGIVGEGQFGSVKEATIKSTGARVALKLIRVNRLTEGIPHPVAREAILTRKLRCPHVVQTYDVFPWGSFIVIAMERCQTDLGAVLRSHTVYNPLPLDRARKYFEALLQALRYLHNHGVLHRDVKPSNCLISSADQLKLGDFGLARVVAEAGTDMSHEVASRWYRAPELLFGKRRYGGEVDMWSAGCVLAELLRGFGSPLFAGDGDINQLSRIFTVLGTPTKENWPGVEELPDYGKVHFEPCAGSGLAVLTPQAPEDAVDLLRKLVTLNPEDRCTAQEALQHPFIQKR